MLVGTVFVFQLPAGIMQFVGVMLILIIPAGLWFLVAGLDRFS